MSFIRCGDHLHWGRYGAAGVALTTPARDRILLQLRSSRVLDPHTWAVPGGAIHRGETPVDGALRETEEETGLDPGTFTVHGTLAGLVHPRWAYTYVLATTEDTDLPQHTSWEVAEHRWFLLEEVPELHPALARDWARLLQALG